MELAREALALLWEILEESKMLLSTNRSLRLLGLPQGNDGLSYGCGSLHDSYPAGHTYGSTQTR